jgi:hypothetical protein
MTVRFYNTQLQLLAQSSRLDSKGFKPQEERIFACCVVEEASFRCGPCTQSIVLYQVVSFDCCTKTLLIALVGLLVCYTHLDLLFLLSLFWTLLRLQIPPESGKFA